MGRILAIDYGQKRTGLAVTDPLRIAANPLLTLPTHQLEDWLKDYFTRNQVDEVVIGHPTQLIVRVRRAFHFHYCPSGNDTGGNEKEAASRQGCGR